MPTAPAEPKDKPKANRRKKSLHVYLEPALRDAVDVLVARSRRDITEEVAIALEEYLERHGLWPPPPAGDG